MGARGSYSAFTALQGQRLLAASRRGGGDDEQVLELFDSLRGAAYVRGADCQALDKAWDNIHRALTLDNTEDGCLDEDAGDYPFNLLLFGGWKLYHGDDYHLYLIEPDGVAALASALHEVDVLWL